MDSEKSNIPFIRKWWISLRLFSLPFAIIPFVFGLLLATSIEGNKADPLLTFLALTTVTTFSMATNLLSDIMDFKKGIDRWAHSTSGGIVRGWISLNEARFATVLFYVIGAVTCVWIAWIIGPWIIPVGIAGFIFSLFYAAGDKYAFKYNFLGEYCVMFAYGAVIPLWAFTITAGHYALWPILWSVPMGFILAAVKHANNWLEANLEDHRQPGITAVKLGNNKSRWYYIALVLMPYLLYLFMIVPSPLLKEGTLIPATFYIVFLSLPYTIILLIKSMKFNDVLKPDRKFQLDTLTGGLFILFGTLCCMAVYFT